VLDEPTNHLDLESRESLEAALEAFPGTVLLVSHDRALLDAVSGRLLAIEDGRLVSYAGGWAEYQQRAEPTPEAAPPPPPKAKKKTREPQRQKQSQSPLELVEREIARSESRVAELERQLAEDWTNVDLVAAHRAAREDLAGLLARWESLFGT
jgi:ATP-binding cassette subfamily F protein 3